MNRFFRVVLAAAAVLLLPKVMELAAPFIIGFLIYLLCRKTVTRLEKTGISRGVGAFFSLAFALSVAAAVCALAFTAVYNESGRLPVLYQKAVSVEINSPLVRKFFDSVRGELNELIKELSVMVLSWAGNLPAVLMILLFSILSAFFFLKDEKKIINIMFNIWGNGFLENILRLKETVCGALSGYIRAQLILMTITFLILSVFFVLFKVKYALLIAFGTAFIDAIPVFGTGCILLPWALWQFLFGSRSLAFALTALYGVCSLVRQILEPKIISSHIGLHPLLTLAGVFIGFKLFGIAGLILGPVAILVFVTYIQNRQ